MKTYKVGGSIRDKLIGIHSHTIETDWLVVGATPEQMETLGFKLVGREFPIFLHPKTKEEYALARTERKAGKGYKGFKVYFEPTVKVEEDLYRRDLTINAIAEDTETGELIDPYDGLTDIKNKVLRHVSLHFSEDPLRVLRVARFYAKLYPYNFKVDPTTEVLVQNIYRSGELDTLSNDRKWIEIEKVLGYECSDQFFIFLNERGLLSTIYPGFEDQPEFSKILAIQKTFNGHNCQNHLKLLTLIPLKKNTFNKHVTESLINILIKTYPIQKETKVFLRLALVYASYLYKEKLDADDLIRVARETKASHSLKYIENLEFFFHSINEEDKATQRNCKTLNALIVNFVTILRSSVNLKDNSNNIFQLKKNIATELLG
jgi:tRNA nucleotidyltransferase/poly(A) polymerase